MACSSSSVPARPISKSRKRPYRNLERRSCSEWFSTASIEARPMGPIMVTQTKRSRPSSRRTDSFHLALHYSAFVRSSQCLETLWVSLPFARANKQAAAKPAPSGKKQSRHDGEGSHIESQGL